MRVPLACVSVQTVLRVESEVADLCFAHAVTADGKPAMSLLIACEDGSLHAFELPRKKHREFLARKM